MSILLDALRKSERQQRKGALPDIHAEDPTLESARDRGSRGWVPWFLGAIVVAVLCVYGWRAWQANQVPTAEPEYTDEPQVTSAPARNPPATEPAAASAPAQRPAPQASAPPATSTATAQVTPGPRLDRQPRSPVETLSTDRPLESAPRPAPPVREAQEQPAPGDTAGSPASTPPAAAAAAERTEAQRRREAQLAALQQAVETTGVPEEERMPPSRNARPARAPDDGAISFWQLPEMTRDSLPELRINVMVYDEEPAKRFIILGGKRYGEGDEISNNLQLETVQRDRALFRYGAYLFYVKQ